MMDTEIIQGRRGLIDLARLYDYPEADFPNLAQSTCEQLAAEYPAAAVHLLEFSCDATQYTTEAMEEVHTRTFSLSPVCVPYIGWQMFGENNFKRGEFMGSLSVMFERHKLDIAPELPDHIAAMILLAAHIPAEELDEMLEWCLLPGTEKMVTGTERLTTPYRHLLKATHEILKDLQEKVHNG